jgi:hypothetical protein
MTRGPVHNIPAFRPGQGRNRASARRRGNETAPAGGPRAGKAGAQ